MSDNKRRASNKAKEPYLLSGIIECEGCGAAYVGHTSTNTRAVKTRYYVCGNKYRTRSCKARNINADVIETFVMIQLREYIKDSRLKEIAEAAAHQVNHASPDLTAEKAEQLEIGTKLKNGTTAILSGMDYPELREEMDKLRMRKSELEDIIASVGAGVTPISADRILERIKEAAERLEENPQAAIKLLIKKKYAHSDGSFTVEVGVPQKTLTKNVRVFFWLPLPAIRNMCNVSFYSAEKSFLFSPTRTVIWSPR